MSLYAPPKDLPTEIFTTMPAHFRKDGQEAQWVTANRPGETLDCFLEGPGFDKDGNLLVVDIPFGRIFSISPDGEWSLVIEYDGWPNGMRQLDDGTALITDYKNGLMLLDVKAGTIQPFLTHRITESFIGVNDLIVDRQGLVYFTDQGQTGMHDPTGRVYRYDPASKRLDRLLSNGPSPNGIALNPEEKALYVAMTRGNAVWRVPLMADGSVAKAGIFVQMAGGVAGADGIAVDSEGRLLACDVGNGCVWVFTKFGEPVWRVKACIEGRATTNLCFGGPENKSLFITESSSGTILRAEMDVSGLPLNGKLAG